MSATVAVAFIVFVTAVTTSAARSLLHLRARGCAAVGVREGACHTPHSVGGHRVRRCAGAGVLGGGDLQFGGPAGVRRLRRLRRDLGLPDQLPARRHRHADLAGQDQGTHAAAADRVGGRGHRPRLRDLQQLLPSAGIPVQHPALHLRRASAHRPAVVRLPALGETRSGRADRNHPDAIRGGTASARRRRHPRRAWW